MTQPITIKTKVRFDRGRRGTKELKIGKAAPPPVATGGGRVPRVARLLALAHRFEGLIRDGVVRDYADLARLGHVSRARVTQIMDLLLLAPDIQEQVLFLPEVEHGRDPVDERHLRRVVAELDWRRQRKLWKSLDESAILRSNAID